MSQTSLIFEAHRQNYDAFWEAINAKAPLVAFGGIDYELIRFHNVKESPFNHQGFIGRDWFLANKGLFW